MSKTKSKVEYSVEDVPGEDIQRIFRAEGNEKEAVAMYDQDAGIVELIKGKESFKQRCIAHLKDKGYVFKEVCKIGTDIKHVPDGAPPMPKKSRIQGEKTDKLVEWYAKYRPDFFLDKYGVLQMQERTGWNTHTRKVRDGQGNLVDEEYKTPIYEDVDHFDFEVDQLKSGKQRLIARMKTILTEKSQDDQFSEEFDDELDTKILAGDD